MNKISITDLVIIALIGVIMSIVWNVYNTFVWHLLFPVLRIFQIDGILSGIWLVGGTFFGALIRKPGSAFLGEFIPAILESIFSHFGILDIIFGVFQGIGVEIYFLLIGYKNINRFHMAISGILAALGCFFVTFIQLGYYHMSLMFNILECSSMVVSGILSNSFGVLWLLNRLKRSRVFFNYYE